MIDTIELYTLYFVLTDDSIVKRSEDVDKCYAVYDRVLSSGRHVRLVRCRPVTLEFKVLMDSDHVREKIDF